MEKTLKIIKDKYGEPMSHFCRHYFSTILNNNPKLLSILLEELFAPTRELYQDLVKYHLEYDFAEYVYSFISTLQKQNVACNLTPEQLLKTVGYTLYECHTKEDIMQFIKYYAPGEELCTFNEDRLKTWHVYFAVHDNANKLHRQDFSNPHRQDEYGTSVISIQFSRVHHFLSIKNRYNHTVSNPDATFSNNLDNIIPGLTKAFEKHKGIISHTEEQIVKDQILFEIPGYVLASDGRYYKYNYEINGIYYCPNNTIIDNYEVISYPHESYIIIDYFILNLQDKTCTLYDPYITDCFPEFLGFIKNIQVINDKPHKKIIITNHKNQQIILNINHLNNLVAINHQQISKSIFSTYKYLKY